MNRFHEAARQGQLDILREATRKDANGKDDTGRSPTVWAAYEGNTDALRILIARGGDPEECDIQGYTALHYAAMSNHLNTVTFLVSYGCNIWAMTNDHRTAKDLVAENNHVDCLAFLDDVAADQSARNRKEVKKLKEKALLDADKRAKKLDKLKKKHDKTMQEEERRLAKEEEKQQRRRSSSNRQAFSRYLAPDGGRGRSPSNTAEQRGGVGQQSDSRSGSLAGTRSSISGTISDDEDEVEVIRGPIKIDGSQRPGDSATVDSLQSLPPVNHNETRVAGDGNEDILSGAVSIEQTHMINGNSAKDAPGVIVTNYDVKSDGDFANDDGDYDTDDDDENLSPGTSDLEFFLSVLDLSHYLPRFTTQEIDLKALMLMSEENIHVLGLPLGPEIKLIASVARRRKAIDAPGAITDTQL